jgi:hypothetical protein
MLAKHLSCLDPTSKLGGVVQSLLDHIDRQPPQLGAQFLAFCGAQFSFRLPPQIRWFLIKRNSIPVRWTFWTFVTCSGCLPEFSRSRLQRANGVPIEAQTR